MTSWGTLSGDNCATSIGGLKTSLRRRIYRSHNSSEGPEPDDAALEMPSLFNVSLENDATRVKVKPGETPGQSNRTIATHNSPLLQFENC